MQHGTKYVLNSLALGLLVCSLQTFADKKVGIRIIKTQPVEQKKDEQEPSRLQRLREGAANFIMYPVRNPLNTLMMMGSAYGLTKLSLDVARLIVHKRWIGQGIAYDYVHGVEWLLSAGTPKDAKRRHVMYEPVLPDPRIDALERRVDALTEITGVENCKTSSNLHGRLMTLEDRAQIRRDERQQPWGVSVAERRAMLAQSGRGKIDSHSPLSGSASASGYSRLGQDSGRESCGYGSDSDH